jgi:hypothetical protein
MFGRLERAKERKKTSRIESRPERKRESLKGEEEKAGKKNRKEKESC